MQEYVDVTTRIVQIPRAKVPSSKCPNIRFSHFLYLFELCLIGLAPYRPPHLSVRQFPFVSMTCIIERISLFETAQINNVYSLEGVWPARLMHMMVSFFIYGFTYIALIRSSIIGITLSIVILSLSNILRLPSHRCPHP